ncbi:hypothetical protein ACNKHK_12565 [Shigella flexneri]
MQRVRELTVRPLPVLTLILDLSSIQDEIKSRLDEIDRVSGRTKSTALMLLSKDGSIEIQVGANDGQTISMNLKKIDS